jgi:tetratricopeptide (TPR) repeat protein
VRTIPGPLKYLPVSALAVVVFILSFRMLSDPDIGTHLKAGKWIVENRAVPAKDTFTFTVNDHDYLDANWLFQVLSYGIYLLAGYNGLSVFVAMLSLSLLLGFLLGSRISGIPPGISCLVILAGFLLIETRITLRPEMFTFLYITVMMMVLDSWYHYRKNRLYLLPAIMLLWCNMHGLFVLGLVIIAVYLVSLLARDRRPDGTFSLWAGISVLACLINPYFFKGFTFPLELFTRLDTGNIFHQHIKELKSFYQMDRLVAKDILFIAYAGVTVLAAIVTFRRRKIHELILLAVFLYLALAGIRNIALFAVVTVPLLSGSLEDILSRLRQKEIRVAGILQDRGLAVTGIALYILLLAGLGLRLLTDAYYTGNASYNRTGAGVDVRHLPAGAAGFLAGNRLDGRILNSLSFGGWLSWAIPQPVFIDGRLEVIGEKLYDEVQESWSGGLGSLLEKYKPDLILYNYEKYYPWTVQLARIPGWKVIWLDGFSVVFAREGYAPGVPAVSLATLPAAWGLAPLTTPETESILRVQEPAGFTSWFRGFYSKPDYASADFLNIASFCLQFGERKAAERLFLENLRRTQGKNTFIYYALADIYQAENEPEKARICLERLPSGLPAGVVVPGKNAPAAPSGRGSSAMPEQHDDQAVLCFNEGNRLSNEGDYSGAVRQYEKAVLLKPDYYKAYNNLGILAATVTRDYPAAIGYFTKAISVRPDYADAFLGRGTSKYGMRDFAGACEDWRKALSLGSQAAAKLIGDHCR